jgi:hypothetical protein
MHPRTTTTLAQVDIEVSLAVDLANPKLKLVVYASGKRPRFQAVQGEPITLYLSSDERVSAAVARRRVRITRSHPDSHPVYCALTLLTPGRATLKRRSQMPERHPPYYSPHISHTLNGYDNQSFGLALWGTN